MSEHDEETRVIEAVPDPGPPTNVMEALIARRQEHVGERHYDLLVPGMHGLMALRLKALSAKQLQTIADRAEKSKSPHVGLNTNLDTLSNACEAVLGRASEDDPFTVLPGASGDPVTIGEELAAMLKLEVTQNTSRAVLLAVFDRANAPAVAIGAAATDYIEWARSENEDIDEEALGES